MNSGGFISPEQIRDLFAGNKGEIDNVVRRMQMDLCPCCGMTNWYKEGTDHLEECGHPLCDRCIENHHECIPCALST